MPGTENDDPTSPQPFRTALEDSPARAASVLATAHAADAAEWLRDVDFDDAWRVFALLSTEYQADLIEHAEDPLRHELVARMSPFDLREVVEELPTDEAVDVLAEADDQVAARVLDEIPDETAQELRQLAAHDPDTAGGVMTTEFVTVHPTDRVGDAVKAVKKEGEEAEANLGVFVVDENQVPVGYISDRALLTNSIHEPVTDVMVEPFLVAVDEDQEEAATLIMKYGLAALAVVGQAGVLLGVISAEDAHEILAEEAIEDIHRMVGTSPVLQTRLPIWTRVVQRLPLMGVTVLGGLASAGLLAWALGPMGGRGNSILRYLPLIVGLAGNVGVQSSTILVRAFATGEVERERDRSVLVSEVSVGALIGLICGTLTLVAAAWMEGDWILGSSVGLAVVAAVVWAALLGCVVPMGCRRLGVDPAIVAGPFLISLSDISGVGIYIGVARSLLKGFG